MLNFTEGSQNHVSAVGIARIEQRITTPCRFIFHVTEFKALPESSMYSLRSVNNLSAMYESQGLVAKADTQDGYVSTLQKYPQTYTYVGGARRRSRSRGDDDVVEGPVLVHPVEDVPPRPLVVAHNHRRHCVGAS